MKFEKEITVEVTCSLVELKDILEKNNFKLQEEYTINDIYMFDKDYVSNDYLELLSHCILIRYINGNREYKEITYKYKEYNDKKEIIREGKINCGVTSIQDAIDLFKAIGYDELITLNDEISVYSNDVTEFAVQKVNNKHLYIELEEKCQHISREYGSIKEMINDLNHYGLPIKEDNYFVRKAEIELKDKYQN